MRELAKHLCLPSGVYSQKVFNNLTDCVEGVDTFPRPGAARGKGVMGNNIFLRLLVQGTEKMEAATHTLRAMTLKVVALADLSMNVFDPTDRYFPYEIGDGTDEESL